MPLVNERTGAVVLADPDATSLVLGRKIGEAILVSFDGTDVVLFLEEIRPTRCSIRVVAHPSVEIARLRGDLGGN